MFIYYIWIVDHHFAQGAEKESNQADLVGDMITAAHLKHSQYDYSLSTFLSEANIR